MGLDRESQRKENDHSGKERSPPGDKYTSEWGPASSTPPWHMNEASLGETNPNEVLRKTCNQGERREVLLTDPMREASGCKGVSYS